MANLKMHIQAVRYITHRIQLFYYFTMYLFINAHIFPGIHAQTIFKYQYASSHQQPPCDTKPVASVQ